MPQDRLNNEWTTTQSRRAPTDDKWRLAMINHCPGTHVNGTVLSHHAFSFFVDLGETVNGLVEAPYIKDRRPGEDGYSDDFPAVGTDIAAVVLGIAEHNRQIRLSMRPSDLARDSWEPDPEEHWCRGEPSFEQRSDHVHRSQCPPKRDGPVFRPEDRRDCRLSVLKTQS